MTFPENPSLWIWNSIGTSQSSLTCLPSCSLLLLFALNWHYVGPCFVPACRIWPCLAVLTQQAAIDLRLGLAPPPGLVWVPAPPPFRQAPNRQVSRGKMWRAQTRRGQRELLCKGQLLLTMMVEQTHICQVRHCTMIKRGTSGEFEQDKGGAVWQVGRSISIVSNDSSLKHAYACTTSCLLSTWAQFGTAISFARVVEEASGWT